MLHQYAMEMGLLDARSVPFGMSPAFLEKDPNSEQHFLRTRNHPFGRYENQIPFFRGIPPYILQFFFIQTVMTLDLDMRAINIERPGDRATLQVLLLLHQAIEQRCQSLPLLTQLEPKNDKQKYAKIYRDGQARIVHSIRRELRAVIDKLRVFNTKTSQSRPRLLSTLDGLTALEADFPVKAGQFRKGLTKHQLDDPQDEGIIWTLLLVSLVALLLTSKTSEGNDTFSWLRNLFIQHPLPALEEGIEDAETYTFVDENIGDFIHSQNADSDTSPIEVLDDLGLTFVNQPADSSTSVFINGRTENLGVRVIMWAMRVVEQEVVPVFEDGVVRRCLYVRAVGENGGDAWMYKDVEVSGEH